MRTIQISAAASAAASAAGGLAAARSAARGRVRGMNQQRRPAVMQMRGAPGWF